MKKLVICFSLMIPSIGFCCPSLEGTWQSSIQKFELFNKKWANVGDKAWSFMIQTQGYEVIEFNNANKMHISTPEIEVKMGEKKMKLPAKEEHIKFDILGCTHQSIVLKYERYGKAQLTQLHFEKDNTYWEYMGTSDGDGNSHVREYYNKVK
ncbi:hypothetical protein HG263_12965 [Pseudoalteromonas sp. JBTF-M23]|uniref:Lipoprotein n=1 Tax=Pseudoalteromonas caenipelagi TaxID=2726988 RepID=A0A849VI82_9GAMM|nr:hypothetical protein [Pseudoalteromonas caenipelagi]NOU51441.1 hypothetical protein [Pseudoalteromonas caenipelagi]